MCTGVVFFGVLRFSIFFFIVFLNFVTKRKKTSEDVIRALWRPIQMPTSSSMPEHRILPQLMELEVGICISVHIFAALFRSSTLPPARLSSGWIATGATDLPKTSRMRRRPGWILLFPTPDMHLFSRLFPHRMLFSLRNMGVLNHQNEWTSESDRVSAPLVVSIALPFVRPSVGSCNSPPRYLL